MSQLHTYGLVHQDEVKKTCLDGLYKGGICALLEVFSGRIFWFFMKNAFQWEASGTVSVPESPKLREEKEQRGKKRGIKHLLVASYINYIQ